MLRFCRIEFFKNRYFRGFSKEHCVQDFCVLRVRHDNPSHGATKKIPERGCCEKILIFLAAVLFFVGVCNAIPIETPDVEERNNFVIKCPKGWGYRTFKGNNGLIGVMWPVGTSFYSTDTAAFIFLQDNRKELPKVPCNINLFTEKCSKAKFKFLPKESMDDKTLSLGEQYFDGRCGRTMVIMKASIEPYSIVIMVAAAKYITKKQLADLKEITANYKAEIQSYIERKKMGEIDSSDNN